ncbi:LD-carboxypeptidase [Dactylosporangium sp. NPDC049742]|uniref:S66 peptidase family protein n=1 Tax=Dactylosporangium sp. NPDC049742 TaxID=3154737 RepID=UPI0034172350
MRTLRRGDVVGLVSPSGPTRPDRVARGIELLSGWGLEVRAGRHVFDRSGYLAGHDADRLSDLNEAFEDPEIRAVVCTRGGYGAQRIVDGLRLASPKHLVGFSDITALQLAVWRRVGWASVHGPGGAWFDDRLPASSAESLRAALFTSGPLRSYRSDDEETSAVTVPGPVVGGVLLGGNLSMLASTAGTADMPSFAGAIMVLEDVGEAPYRVDRMLTHLRRAGAFEGVAGVAVGQFTDCVGAGPTVVDVLRSCLGGLGVPVLGGLRIGHGVGQETVVLGARAELDTTVGCLTSRADQSFD